METIASISICIFFCDATAQIVINEGIFEA